MISNHYPFIYGHAYNWLALVAIGALLAWGRHFFNLKHRGIIKPGILISAVVGMVFVAVVMAHTNTNFASPLESAAIESVVASENETDQMPSRAQRVQQLVSVHCTNCHATAPRQAGFTAAPGGLVIEGLAQLTQHKMRATPAIQSGYMPLGNFTQITDEERQLILSWLAEQ